MRLAWFTPWPPETSFVGRRSRDAARALVQRGYEIDLLVDDRDGGDRPAPAAGAHTSSAAPDLCIEPAAGFDARSADRDYDLAIYQLSNSPASAFIWPHLFRRPGLTVLHEARLYAARAATAREHPAAYRAEFAWNHPDVAPEAAELAVAGFAGEYASLWPMARTVVDASRLVAVHSRGGATDLQQAWPAAPIMYVAPGIDAPPPDASTRSAWRSELGLSADAVVFGLVGPLTGAHRVPQVLRAFANTVGRVPEARLLLAGVAGPGTDPRDLADALGIGNAVSIIGPLGAAARMRAMAVIDVCLDLHWPDTVSTTDDWLCAIAAGRPTVFMDLAHTADTPALDPRSWQPAPAGRAPVGVAIDILDEDHSLRLALHRLAVDAPLRERLGHAAHEHWRAAHTVAHMADDYVGAIDRAMALPVQPVRPRLRPTYQAFSPG